MVFRTGVLDELDNLLDEFNFKVSIEFRIDMRSIDSRKAFYKMPHNKKWKSIDRKLENSKIQSKKLEEEKQ